MDRINEQKLLHYEDSTKVTMKKAFFFLFPSLLFPSLRSRKVSFCPEYLIRYDFVPTFSFHQKYPFQIRTHTFCVRPLVFFLALFLSPLRPPSPPTLPSPPLPTSSIWLINGIYVPSSRIENFVNGMTIISARLL